MKTPIRLTLIIMLFCFIGLHDAKAIIAIKTIKSLGDSCAEIRLFSGQTYSVKLIEIGNLTAKYTTCPKSDGKVSSINLTSIYRITMADGSVIYQYKKIANAPIADTTSKKSKLKNYTTQQSTNRFGDESKSYNILAVIGIISSALFALSYLVTLFGSLYFLSFLILPLGLSALICPIIALVQMKYQVPEKKGKGLAIAALTLLVSSFLLTLLYLLLIF